MRYLLFFTVSFFLFSMMGYAQEISYGVKGGMNFSSIRSEFNDTNKAKFGFHVGFVAEIPLLQNLSVQPEILYSLQGAKDDARAGDGPLVNTTLQYIHVPLLAKYYLIDNLSLMAGPNVGFLVSAQRETTPSGFGGNTEIRNEDIKKELKNLDLGAAVGVAYKFNFGLFLQARYVAGITDIDDNSSFRNKSRNNLIQVSTGYFF